MFERNLRATGGGRYPAAAMVLDESMFRRVRFCIPSQDRPVFGV